MLPRGTIWCNSTIDVTFSYNNLSRLNRGDALKIQLMSQTSNQEIAVVTTSVQVPATSFSFSLPAEFPVSWIGAGKLSAIDGSFNDVFFRISKVADVTVNSDGAVGSYDTPLGLKCCPLNKLDKCGCDNCSCGSNLTCQNSKLSCDGGKCGPALGESCWNRPCGAGYCQCPPSKPSCTANDRVCSSMPTPTPAPMMGVLRPSFANICFEYRAGCSNATDFCSYKGKYMACTTRSDRCGDYNALSALFDSKCPAVKCQCTSVLNSCLADGSPVAVQCTAPGMVDNCSHCTDCDCEKRCCTSRCTAKSTVVASVDCVANNDLTFADCRCGSKPTSAPTPTPALAVAAGAACAPGTAGCFCSATVKCDVSNGTCYSGICLIRGCVKGEAGCPCAADNTCIGDGLECRDSQCVFPNPCTMAGVAGCQCTDVGTCVGTLNCIVPPNVCLNVRQYTCNPGDDGCWCKSDGSCSSDGTRCVDKGFGRKSCVYAVQPTPMPTPCTSLMCPCRSSEDCTSSKCWQNVCRDCSACSVDPAIIRTIGQASLLNVQTDMTDRACLAYAEYRKCLFSLCSFQDASSKKKDDLCGMDAANTEVLRIARERVCPGLCDPVDVSASISCAPLWWIMLPSLLLQP